MSDEYQLRKDVDKIFDKVYDSENDMLKVLSFRDDSTIRDNSDGTIDSVLDNYYSVGEIDEMLQDLSSDDTNKILALGLGIFKIVDDYLIYECAIGSTCPFSINDDGELVVAHSGDNPYSRVGNNIVYEEEVIDD